MIQATSELGATGRAGNLTIDLLGGLTIGSSGEIAASTYSSGIGGEVTIRAGSLDIGGSGMIAATSDAGATGRAGSIDIGLAGGLAIRDGGEISASTSSRAEAGKVIIQANSMDIEGLSPSAGGSTGIFDQSETGKAGDTGGRARSIDISLVDGLAVRDGGEISASTETAGYGGAIGIQAASVDLGSGAEIVASTSSAGVGGEVSIDAGSLEIQGLAQIAATSSGDGATGRAGSLVIDVSRGLAIESGGEITASTSTKGEAGEVIVHADSMDIDGSATTGIFDKSGMGYPRDTGGRARDINLDVTGGLDIQGGAEISAATETAGHGGDIGINAGSLNLGSGGEIIASTSGAGGGGEVSVDAGSVDIQGSAAIAATSNPNATGPAGSIVIDVPTGVITVQSGGTISVSTYSKGRAGKVNIKAERMNIDGTSTPDGGHTGILDQSLKIAGSPSGGRADDIDIDVTKALTVQNGGEITAATQTSGEGGAIKIRAKTLTVEGSADIDATSEAGATGNSGSISLNILGGLAIEGGGEITASTSSKGNAGDVILQADSVDINGAGTPAASTGIFDQSEQGNPGDTNGAAGNIGVVVIGGLIIQHGGDITAATHSAGEGGDAEIKARSLDVLTGGEISAATFSSGIGGSLAIDAGPLDIDNGGMITASTNSFGHAGNVTVQASSLEIEGDQTGILDQSLPGNGEPGGGAAGTVEIDVNGALSIENGGEITAATKTSGRGGDLTIHAGSVDVSGESSVIEVASLGAGTSGKESITSDRMTVDNGGAISAKAQNSTGGNIQIEIGGSLDLSGGSITAAAGSSGGDITISASALSLDRGSLISANAVQGAGGILTFNLNTGLDAVLGQTSDFVLVGQQVFQSGDSTISATSDAGIPGQLRSSAPYVDIRERARRVGRFRRRCQHPSGGYVRRIDQGQFSSFLEIGQGDIEAAPDEALGSSGEDSEVRKETAGHPKPGRGTGHGL